MGQKDWWNLKGQCHFYDWYFISNMFIFYLCLNSIIVHLIQLFIQLLIKLHLILIQLVGIFFKRRLFGILLLLSLIVMCVIDILLWSLINLITLILYDWFFKTFAVIVHFWYWNVWWLDFLFLMWMIKLCSIVHVIYMTLFLNWWTWCY